MKKQEITGFMNSCRELNRQEECAARMKKDHEEFCRQLEEDRKKWEQLTPEDIEANKRACHERLLNKARTSEGG